MEPLEAFRQAGRTLLSMGLVTGSEGNLSMFDGTVLLITRTGSALGRLGEADVVAGGVDGPLREASGDVEVHRRMYVDAGPGAIAHAHPPGTIPDQGAGPGEHGVYSFAPTLEDAVAEIVRRSREGTS